MNKKYPLVKKAFWVAHKDSIHKTEENTHPEAIEGQVIHVDVKENSNKARRMFYSGSYHLMPPDSKYIDVRAKRRKSEDAYLYEGEARCMNLIRQSEDRKDWLAIMEKLVADNPKAKVRIHSGQWGAYWGANSCGYTNNPDDIGIYDIEDAWSRVSHCGIEKRISFQIVK
jgi:hypothetical protein